MSEDKSAWVKPQPRIEEEADKPSFFKSGCFYIGFGIFLFLAFFTIVVFILATAVKWVLHG